MKRGCQATASGIVAADSEGGTTEAVSCFGSSGMPVSVNCVEEFEWRDVV